MLMEVLLTKAVKVHRVILVVAVMVELVTGVLVETVVAE